MAHGAAREVLGFSLNVGAPVGRESDRRFVGLAVDLHLTRFDIVLGGLPHDNPLSEELAELRR